MPITSANVLFNKSKLLMVFAGKHNSPDLQSRGNCLLMLARRANRQTRTGFLSFE